jgi:hypothetical protein
MVARIGARARFVNGYINGTAVGVRQFGRERANESYALVWCKFLGYED